MQFTDRIFPYLQSVVVGLPKAQWVVNASTLQEHSKFYTCLHYQTEYGPIGLSTEDFGKQDGEKDYMHMYLRDKGFINLDF